MWSDFPPYVVVTGTVQVHGGETRKMQSTAGDGGRVDVHMEKTVTDAKKKGDSVASDYMRRIKKLRVLKTKTPFGNLVHIDRLPDVKRMVASADIDVAEFNAVWKESQLYNCIIWEPLRGNRLNAFKVWLESHPDEASKIKAA